MELFCPRCRSKVSELIECENCGTIGCIKCVKKSYGKWVCFKCETPAQTSYYETESERVKSESAKEDEVSDAFSAMFG
jgi:hypothetical protein